jgi:hypothetical protein
LVEYLDVLKLDGYAKDAISQNVQNSCSKMAQKLPKGYLKNAKDYERIVFNEIHVFCRAPGDKRANKIEVAAD